ncbi:MAG TPA: glycosyltransferase [Bacteroidia bacterium]|jgi:glycosyltransferase involved in cell wall biosynthesis|nr:glycosyltransferase [Bacteroidia bacterium]HQF28504.1 glycosyltransferase [Bacteroidia bacterium]
MPRVLQIINRLNLGGPTFIAGYLAAYLGEGYETMLVAGVKDDSEESSEYIVRDMGIEPVYIDNMRREINFKDDRAAYNQIDKIIKEFKPDIVQTHAAKAGTLGRLAAINNNVPVILHTFHGHVFEGYFSPLKTRIFLEIERYLAKRSSGIIAISNEQKKDLSGKFKIDKPERTFVMPLGIDLERFTVGQAEKRTNFRKAYQLDDETIAIGIIGRLVPIKNHQLFINSFAEVVKKTNKKVHAFIIGDGEIRAEVEQMTTTAGIKFNTPEKKEEGALLTFTSWIKDVDVPVAGLDIIALTSINEGTPVSLIEAQAAGKAIVSTEVGGIRDIVIENKTALLSKLNEPEMLLTNMLEVIENEILRNDLSKNGPAFALSKFGYMRMVNDHKELYKTLLKS